MQNDMINGRTPEIIKSGLINMLNSCGDIRGESTRCLQGLCPYYENDYCEESILINALALIEHLEAKVPRWISVEDRLPESPGRYGVYAFGQIMALDFDENEDWWDDEYNHYNGGVTHWMPLPEPPEEGTK